MTPKTRQETHRPNGLRRGRGVACAAGVAAAIVALGSCDFEVTNPGPVQDEFLNDPLAHPALVAGMGRAVAQGLNWIGYTGAAITREVHPAGSTGSFGITNDWAGGFFRPTDRALNVHWEEGSRAQWVTEAGVDRIQAEPESQHLLPQAQLWAGYANRLMGENYCEAVIDGGAIQPRSTYFERAEQYFSAAAQGGSGDVRTAALAGRASVRVHLGKWAEAAADAAEVPTGFEYRVRYFSVGEDAQRNRIAWAAQGTPYKAHTVWNTVNEGYGLSDDNPNGDPRVPYSYTAGEVGDAAIQCCGQVPFKRQRKFANDAASVRLSSGREARLIEAEAQLVAGNLAPAMDVINAVRANAGVDPVAAGSIAEGWTRLMRERGIELWLEGRRLGDRYRWQAEGRPGELDPLELPSGDLNQGSHLVQQDLCFPIPPTERETNPNVPIGG